MPSFWGEIKLGRGVGGVLQVAPFAARKMIESGGSQGEIFAVLVGGEQSAAGGEYEAQIFGQSLVDPEQIVLHDLLVVGRGEVGGAAVLSVPRVHILVGQQASRFFAGRVVDQRALVDAAIVGFVVLEAEVGNVIAERVEEVIIAVVMCAEKLLRLLDETLVVVPDFLRRIEGGRAVGGDVHFGRGSRRAGRLSGILR